MSAHQRIYEQDSSSFQLSQVLWYTNELAFFTCIEPCLLFLQLVVGGPQLNQLSLQGRTEDHMTRPHLVLFHAESIFNKYSSTCVNDWGHSLHASEFGRDYIVS